MNVRRGLRELDLLQGRRRFFYIQSKKTAGAQKKQHLREQHEDLALRHSRPRTCTHPALLRLLERRSRTHTQPGHVNWRSCSVHLGGKSGLDLNVHALVELRFTSPNDTTEVEARVLERTRVFLDRAEATQSVADNLRASELIRNHRGLFWTKNETNELASHVPLAGQDLHAVLATGPTATTLFSLKSIGRQSSIRSSSDIKGVRGREHTSCCA